MNAWQRCRCGTFAEGVHHGCRLSADDENHSGAGWFGFQDDSFRSRKHRVPFDNDRGNSFNSNPFGSGGSGSYGFGRDDDPLGATRDQIRFDNGGNSFNSNPFGSGGSGPYGFRPYDDPLGATRHQFRFDNGGNSFNSNPFGSGGSPAYGFPPYDNLFEQQRTTPSVHVCPCCGRWH